MLGLGNPGARHAATRHNVGFRIVECLAARHGAVFAPVEALSGRLARLVLGGVDCALLEPTTFMNRSGECVAAALACWPALDPERDCLVVYDDLDLPLGRLRLRAAGSAGGHRGMADIARALASTRLPRLRFGIGHPGTAAAVVDWVLEPFAPEEEREVLPEAIDRAADAVACFLLEGLPVAMDRFNPAP